MIKSSIEKIAKDIGFDIGNSDDGVQGDLLNGFASGLSKIQQDHDREMQYCYIVEKLNYTALEMIQGLLGSGYKF